MNIGREADGSLRVELTASELANFELCYERLNYQDEKTRRLLKTVLKNAGAMTGFTQGDRRLLIEVFPTPQKGCTVYFTPFGNRPKRYRQILPRIYRFDSCENLLAALERLSNIDHELYQLKEQYWLIVQEKTPCRLKEYGDPLPPCRLRLAYIREHGRRLR